MSDQRAVAGSDRFLSAIVAGVVVLVVAVLAVTLLGRNRPSYQPDNTPEGVAHNYLLALQQGDFPRAYGYLSPALAGYPADVEQFIGHVNMSRWDFGYDGNDTSLAIEAVQVTGDGATVLVRETRFFRPGLFDSGQSSSTFALNLRRQESLWKIIHSERYWFYCWDDAKACPQTGQEITAP